MYLSFLKLIAIFVPYLLKKQISGMRARDKSTDNSEKEFKELFFEIKEFYMKETRNANESKINNLCKKIKRYSQLAVWTEKRNSSLFEQFIERFSFFFESKSLELMYNLFIKSQRKEIMLCIIQSLSMMLASLSQATSVHYFLSIDDFMSMLQVKFTSIDVQMAEYYINMLKTISCKLQDHTVHLFFNQKIPTFPLLWQSIRFYNHPQSLIRNTSRNIVLSIFKLNDPKVKEYLVSFPFVIYYSHLASSIKQIWISINDIVTSKRDITSSQQLADNLSLLRDDNIDSIMYIEDLASMCSQKARRYLLTCFLGQCIIPMIRDFAHPKFKFSQRTIFFQLSVILKNTKIPEVAQLIAITLFGKYIPKDLLHALITYESKQPLGSYSKDWSFVNLWDNYFQVVVRNCRNLINSKLRPRSVACEPDPMDRRGLNSQTGNLSQLNKPPSVLQRQIIKIQDWFQVRVACSSRLVLPPKHKIDLLGLLSNLHHDLKQNSFIDLDEVDDNKNTTSLFKFLDVQRQLVQSSDQPTVILCIEMIDQIISNKSISKQILRFCALSNTCDFSSNENLKKILKQLLQIFNKKGGRFQIQTFVAIQQLIRKIVNNNQSKLFDEACIRLTKQTMQSLIQRLTTYALNIKDHMSLLQLYSNAQIYLDNPINKQELQTKALLFDEQSEGITTLNAQIQGDFVVYLLLNRIKAAYIHGNYSYEQLTQLRYQQTSTPSIVGKQIEFPQNTVTADFKDTETGLNFRCFCYVNKSGLIIAEKMTPNKGQVEISCDLVSVICDLRAAELRKLYFTQSTNQGKSRSFCITFGDSKVTFKIKTVFEEQKFAASKLIVDRLVDTFIRCLEDIAPGKPTQLTKSNKQQVKVKSNSPQKKPAPVPQSLIDMWPF